MNLSGPVRKYFLIILLLFGIPIFLVLKCRIDHGLEPIYSKISGKIIFTGEPPANTDGVRVAVIQEFPPRNINELLFSDNIPLYQDTADYEIYLPEGQYDVIAVIWKEKNQPWNISDVIGVYGGTFIGDLLVPTFHGITISDKHAVLDSIDIQTNLNRVNRDAKIEGTITFTGQWPGNTGIIGIGAFTDIPEPGNFIDYYFKNIALDYTIPPFVESAEYKLRVRSSDTINYLVVLWIDSSFNLGSIQDIGFFQDSQDPSQPGVIQVSTDSTVTGIDITVNF